MNAVYLDPLTGELSDPWHGLDDLDAQRYPMPRDCSGRDEVFVGRIREDASSPTGIALWCVSDNLRKGAATNAVQIAELLAAGRRTGAATVRA